MSFSLPLVPRFSGYHAMLIPNNASEQAEFAQRQAALLSKFHVPTNQTLVESEVRGRWAIKYLGVPDAFDTKLLPAIKDERRRFLLPAYKDINDIEVACHLWNKKTNGTLEYLKQRVNREWADEFKPKHV